MLIAIALTLLAGCGLKGDLFIPDAAGNAESADEVPAADGPDGTDEQSAVPAPDPVADESD